MLGFLIVLACSTLIGLQVGLYSVLRQKNINKFPAFSYSFLFYFLPILVISSHVILYKHRFKLLDQYKKSVKLEEDRYNRLKKTFDSKFYIIISIVHGIIDMVTLKDNIIVLVESIEKSYQRRTKKAKATIMRKSGLVGLFVQIIKSLFISMKDHTQEETFEGTLIKKKYAH